MGIKLRNAVLTQNTFPVSLAEPLRVRIGSIEMMTGFIELELAGFCRFRSFCKQHANMRRIQWLKTLGRVDSLLKNRQRITTGDDHAGRKIHRVVQALHRGHCLAFQDKVVAKRLHPQRANIALEQNRQHSLLKTVEVRVHYIQGHLNSIESEAVFGSRGQHLQMNVRTLMAGKSDVAGFAWLLRLQYGL